jgi:hypothetical protein
MAADLAVTTAKLIASARMVAGAKLAARALLGKVRGSTASIELREQQFCAQPGTAVMPVMGQSGAMPLSVPLMAIGQPGAQRDAILAAQVRLERTGCAVRRQITKVAAIGSRRFISCFDFNGKESPTDVR